MNTFELYQHRESYLSSHPIDKRTELKTQHQLAEAVFGESLGDVQEHPDQTWGHLESGLWLYREHTYLHAKRVQYFTLFPLSTEMSKHPPRLTLSKVKRSVLPSGPSSAATTGELGV